MTSTLPADPGGDRAVIDESDSTVKEAASDSPKVTDDAPQRLDPVMVTTVLPFVGPVMGLNSMMAGVSP